MRSEAGPLRKDIPLYVKFTDLSGKDIGNVTKITDMDNDIIVWDQNPTPGMTLTGCKIVMEVTLVECKNVKKNTAGSGALSQCSKLVSLSD